MTKFSRQLFVKLCFVTFAITSISSCGDTEGDATVPTPGAPGVVPGKVSFTDTDTRSGYYGGTIAIEPADSEEDITHYAIYWAKNRSTKVDETEAIAALEAIGSTVSYDLSASTTLPNGASHILAISKNELGEMSTGVSTEITDVVSVPSNAPQAISFTDTDTTYNFIGGTVSITKAESEENVLSYVVYWGSNSTTRLASQEAYPLLTIAAKNENLTATIASSTAIPTGATHLIVYTMNAAGIYSTGASQALSDKKSTAGTPDITTGGTFKEPQTVRLSSANAGVSIYYTTDGTTPTASSTLYSTPFTVSAASTTVKAIAIGTNFDNSAVSTSTFVINTLSNLGYTINDSGTNLLTDGKYAAAHLLLGTSFTQTRSSCTYFNKTVYRFYDGYLLVIDTTNYGIFTASYWIDTLGCHGSTL